MASIRKSKWDELAEIPAVRLPGVLCETLGLQGANFWCQPNKFDSGFRQLPPLDLSKLTQAYTSLGKCSVAVGLYMTGSIDQLMYGEKAVCVSPPSNRRPTFLVQGRLEAGYYLLLLDTYVVPHRFDCWWRIAVKSSSDISETTAITVASPGTSAVVGDAPLTPVQSLGIDGEGVAVGLEPPQLRRPWLPHQQRSFRWMVSREAVRDLFTCESIEAEPANLCNLYLEWKMQKAFDLRGGVLCDPVGSGKTATVLGLVCHDRIEESWGYGVEDVAKEFFADSWLVADATLVLCPDHVHHVWLKEANLIANADALQVLSICTVNELRQASTVLRDSRGTGSPPLLVVVPLSIFQDTEYAKLISPSNVDLREWRRGADSWDVEGLALECFSWRRLVIDEIHELVHTCDGLCQKDCPKATLVRLLRTIRSERRWGLTGTAQEVLQNARSVQCLGRIFRTDFNSETSAIRFIEHYCRTNEVKLKINVNERVELIEHTACERVIYQQHARDICMQGLDGTGEQPLSQDELAAVTPLLKLCSHFSSELLQEGTDAINAGTAQRTAQQIHDTKTGDMNVAQRAVDDFANAERSLMAQEDTKPQATEGLFHVQAIAEAIWVEPRESSLLSGSTGSNADGPLVVVTRVNCDPSVCGGLREGDVVTALGCAPIYALVKVLQAQQTKHAAVDRPADPVEAELHDLSFRRGLASTFRDALIQAANGNGMVSVAWRKTGEAQVATSGTADISGKTVGKGAAIVGLTKLHRQWREATASYQFFDGIWSSIKCSKEKKRECPVCLGDFNAASSGSVLHCGHMFCGQCSHKLFSKVASRSVPCPLCRFSVQSKRDVFDIAYFASRKDEVKAGTVNGSKLDRMAEILQQILDGSKDDRIIIFCQFADLEERISVALRAVGANHVRLSETRSVFEQTAMLEGFQQRRDEQSRVLLLSLEQSASGTNLTAANHVFLVHPMAAGTPQRAAAFEQQAIGRVRRLGQKRTVTVWRFVTQGTVEEELHNRLSPWRSKPPHGSRLEPVRATVRNHAHGETQSGSAIAAGPAATQVRGQTRRNTAPRAASRPAGPGVYAARSLSLRRRSARASLS